jgi:hypothetical protein
MRRFAALVSVVVASAAAAQSAEALPAPVRAPTLIGAPRPSVRAPGYGKPEGLIPGVLVGPKAALVPFPGLLGAGVEAKFLNLVGVSVDYSFFPRVTIADVKASYSDVCVAARVFPWRRSLFVGVALGYRDFAGKQTDAATKQEFEVDVQSLYLAPEIGWRFVWSSGFFMGLDLGYQFILSPKTTFTQPAQVNVLSQTTRKDVEDFGDQFGKIGLPIVSLLQFGFFF